jgi:hypothetical protein
MIAPIVCQSICSTNTIGDENRRRDVRLKPYLFSGQDTDDRGGSHKDVFCRPQTLSYLIHHEISSEDVMIIQYADDFVILTKGKNTDEAMKKLKKVVADVVAQATELELSINGSKCAILIVGKQKTKETIEIESCRELQILGNHDRSTSVLRSTC